MNETFYCGTDSAWARVAIFPGTNVCHLVDFDFPAKGQFEIHISIVLLVALFLFVAFSFIGIFILWLKHHLAFRSCMAHEGDALICRHPPNYWTDNFSENVPYGSIVRGLFSSA